MFEALKKAFGDRYRYAGLGTTLPLGANTGSDMRRGEGPALQQDDLTTYRRLAQREDPFGILRARSMRTKASQLKAAFDNAAGECRGRGSTPPPDRNQASLNPHPALPFHLSP